MVFSYTNNVKKDLDKKNSRPTSGACIYKINCKNCNNFYISQTSKSLETRSKQHIYSVKTVQDSTALFVHF